MLNLLRWLRLARRSERTRPTPRLIEIVIVIEDRVVTAAEIDGTEE